MKNFLMLGALAVVVLFGVDKLEPANTSHKTWFGGAAQAAPAPPQYGRTIHEDQTSICINNRTREHYVGELVGREEVVAELSKHFEGNQIEIMAAISIVEGQRDLNCVGDEMEWLYGKRLYGAKTSDGRTWGESLGLFQIRTIQEDNVPGSCRNDATIRTSIGEQVRCAKEIFNSQSYGAWTQYTNGRYKKELGK